MFQEHSIPPAIRFCTCLVTVSTIPAGKGSFDNRKLFMNEKPLADPQCLRGAILDVVAMNPLRFIRFYHRLLGATGGQSQ
jgi:hypothetical protein